ncbi:MAG TPA: molybdopterin molybdotransferase MoeA [Candidatus Nesterenkonia stercoripullorum]|uniref:Molybdopterin molybdenumtransferase n=1 Tax=Candidatus Nesterenkonia stercoripullorum TaxID=2838701 RepID=A0A9D1URR5_9MICC|nr:molybdopterin molybdotransferase MoeA [Candidatus Nesterenkonia stercoripullorum]
MLSLRQARTTAAAAAALPVETLTLEAAIGRTLARDVAAAFEIPHASTSAMDGWAVRGPGPWRIVPTSPEHPGEPLPALGPGEAVAVLTGSVIPGDVDSVLRTEHAHSAADLPADSPTADDRSGQGLLSAQPDTPDTQPGRNIRPAGVEAQLGDRLLSAGSIITPVRAALLAVAGTDEVDVVRRAGVALVLTGSEVITSGRPDPGQVRDVFGVALPDMLREAGAEVIAQERIHDDAQQMDEALAAASSASRPADLIIITGGTAHSRADHLRPALHRAGAATLVDSVEMRPGHPVVLARLPRGTYVLGLPGNPLAGFAALAAVGHPLLAALHGEAQAEAAEMSAAIAGEDFTGPRSGERLVPARQTFSGILAAGHDRAHMMRGIAEADVFAVVPAGGVGAGERVDVLPVPGGGAVRGVNARRRTP